MGLAASAQRFNLKKPAVVIFVGLDSSGKTTLLSHLSEPYQFYPSSYTNGRLLQKDKQEREGDGDKEDQDGSNQAPTDKKKKKNGKKRKNKDKGGEGKGDDGDDHDDTDDDEAASDEDTKKADTGSIVPPPDLAPFRDVILPTCGVQLREFVFQSQHVRAWDFSGQGRYRSLWQEYYLQAAGIVFVVDGQDKNRMGIARREFNEMMAHPILARDKPPVLMVLNNYETEDDDDDGGDLLTSTTVTADHVQHMFSTKRRKAAVKVIKADAISGKGIREGFGWLLDRIADKNSA